MFYVKRNALEVQPLACSFTHMYQETPAPLVPGSWLLGKSPIAVRAILCSVGREEQSGNETVISQSMNSLRILYLVCVAFNFGK